MENLKNVSKISENDLDFIVGGSQIDVNINKEEMNYKKTFDSHKCNCNSFESTITSKSKLNICDNCKWARAPKENCKERYCTKQILTK